MSEASVWCVVCVKAAVQVQAARHSFMQMHREELNTSVATKATKVFFSSLQRCCVACTHAAIVHYVQNIHVKCVKHLQFY